MPAVSFQLGAILVLAASAIGVIAILTPSRRAQFVFAQLCLMSGIYLGFALARLDGATIITKANWSVLIVETAIALGFMFAGLAVLASGRVWLLGALILMHGGTDLLHLLISSSAAPDWYAFLCCLYDAIVGVAAIVMLSPKPANAG